jgi:hypothetical protein
MARSLIVLAVLSLAVMAPPASAQTPDIYEGPDIHEGIDLASRAARLKRAAATRAKLARRVNFDGIINPKTTLADALQFFERSYGVGIDINEQAFKDEGVMGVLDRPIGKAIPKLQGVPLSTVLRRILERVPSRSGVTFFARGGVVEISTGRAYRYELSLTGAIVSPAPPAMPGR